jgi:microcystin-dependent protein
MSEPFLGELRIMPYGGNYVTRGWLPCQGQTLQIRQYTALYALLGVQYGGNGQTTFNLPDLRGRAAIGAGQGAGLSNYSQGTTAGVETVTLQQTQLPAHNHPIGTPLVSVNSITGTATSPAGGFIAGVGTDLYGSAGAGPMAPNMLNGPTTSVGGNQPHENRMPYMTLNYFIAIEGVFPQRS